MGVLSLDHSSYILSGEHIPLFDGYKEGPGSRT